MSSIESESFDAAYAIESTCHAGDKEQAFREINRVLKPGGLLCGQEMCLTDVFDENDQHHQTVKLALMRKIALYDIYSFDGVTQALERVDFEVLEAEDLGAEPHSPVPWFLPMKGMHGLSAQSFRRTPFGRAVVHFGVGLAELVRLFPKGTKDVIAMMEEAAQADVSGGETGIYTPLYCFLARKKAPNLA